MCVDDSAMRVDEIYCGVVCCANPVLHCKTF